METEKSVEVFIAIWAKALRREAKDETPWDPARAMGKLALDTTGPLMPEGPEKLRRFGYASGISMATRRLPPAILDKQINLFNLGAPVFVG